MADNNKENLDTAALSAEGEKVTGGSGSAAADTTSAETPGQKPTANDELTPNHETKKEDMDGYNEHPDQDKVGGG